MYIKSSIAVAVVLLILGLVIPLWYVAIVGLVILSALVPLAGVCVGFLLDIVYGAPPLIPAVLAFPCLLGASVIGVLSLFVRTYLR